MKLRWFVRNLPRWIERRFINMLMYVDYKSYMSLLIRHLRRLGVHVDGRPNSIANDVWLDSTDYSLIEIGHDSTLSKGVILLTHDASPYCALHAAGYEYAGRPRLGVVHVGSNSFIGAGSILLPETHIGDNTIVGAGSVVRGHFPDGVVIVGNPATVVASTVDWIKRKLESSESYRALVRES